MHAWLRKISRLVLLVMLTTVFSPSFGWEMAEGMAPHGHVMSVEHEHHDDAVAVQMVAEECAEIQHHCCPGHQLGHMQASIVEGQNIPLPVADNRLHGFISSRFTSYVPEGLERPPRAHFA